MEPTIYVALETPLGTRWVYQVPSSRTNSADEVRRYGVCCAARHDGVWQVAGTCTIHDLRYLAILEDTPVLKS